MRSHPLFLSFANLVKRFAVARNGAIAVETAFILPILITLSTFAFEAAAFMKMKERHLQTVTAIGDIVSSADGNVSCKMLDNLADLAVEMYREGNWSSLLDVTAKGNEAYLEIPFWLSGYKVQEVVDEWPYGLQQWRFTKIGYEPGDEGGFDSWGDKVPIPYKHYEVGDQAIILMSWVSSYMPGQMFGLWGSSHYNTGDVRVFAPRYVTEVGLNGPYKGGDCNLKKQ